MVGVVWVLILAPHMDSPDICKNALRLFCRVGNLGKFLEGVPLLAINFNSSQVLPLLGFDCLNPPHPNARRRLVKRMADYASRPPLPVFRFVPSIRSPVADPIMPRRC